MGRRLSRTASVAVNIREEFIPPWWSPSFILAGQHLPKLSHSLEQMTGQSLASWRAGEGPPETEGQLRFSLAKKARQGWKLDSSRSSAGFVLYMNRSHYRDFSAPCKDPL